MRCVGFLRCAVALGWGLLLCHCGPAPRAPLAQRGVLDLRGFDWRAQPTVGLAGEFEFYWNEWRNPGEAKHTGTQQASHGFLRVPARWNEFVVDGRPVGSRGIATYRLRVLLDPNAPPLAIRVIHFDSAHRLFVNGRLVHEAGRLGKDEATSAGGRLPGIGRDLPRVQELVVVAHVSNFQHQNGGWPRAALIGEATAVQDLRLRETLVDVFLFGGLLIMGLYHLGLYALRRRDMSTLFFALFCLVTAIRTLLIGERVVEHIVPGVPFLWALRLDYLAFLFSAPLFLAYAGRAFPGAFFPPVLTALWVVCGAGAAYVLFASSFDFSRINPLYQLVTLIVGAYILVVIAIAAARRRQGALTFLLGFAILFATVINDLAFARQWIRTGYFVSYGLFAFVLVQAFLLSRRLLAAFRTAEKLAGDLADSEQRYRHLVEDSGEIIVSLDEDGRIRSVNQTVRQVLGYQPARVMGQRLSDLLYAGDASRTLFGRQLFEERLQTLRRTGSEQQFSAQFRTANGEACELSVRLQWVELRGGHNIFGNLARRAENQLARYCVEDRRTYQIPSSFSLAEILNRSVTASLEGHMSEGDLTMVRLALREILVNSIEHGNLSISFSEKTEATERGALLELIAERQANELFRDRTVRVSVELANGSAIFHVRDEGDGFDHGGMVERARRQADNPDQLLHGRGLAFAVHLFDEITYNEKGNEVRLTKRLA